MRSCCPFQPIQLSVPRVPDVPHVRNSVPCVPAGVPHVPVSVPCVPADVPHVRFSVPCVPADAVQEWKGFHSRHNVPRQCFPDCQWGNKHPSWNLWLVSGLLLWHKSMICGKRDPYGEVFWNFHLTNWNNETKTKIRKKKTRIDNKIKTEKENHKWNETGSIY